MVQRCEQCNGTGLVICAACCGTGLQDDETLCETCAGFGDLGPCLVCVEVEAPFDGDVDIDD